LGGGEGGEPLELSRDIAAAGGEIAQSLRELEKLVLRNGRFNGLGVSRGEFHERIG